MKLLVASWVLGSVLGSVALVHTVDVGNGKPGLLVANQGDGTMSIVDLGLKRQVASVQEGVPSVVAHEVAVSKDGRRAFLPLYSNTGLGKPGTDGQFMLVVDLASRKVVDRVDFGHGVRPHCAVLDPVSGLLYVTTELDQSVTVIDPDTLKIVGSIPTRQEQSHMLAISHDGRRGYTANPGPGTVSVLDVPARKFVTTIRVASNVQRISVSNDDRWVITADQTAPRLAVIDASSNTVKSWVPLPSIGYGTTFSRDGRWLLVTLIAAGQLGVIDTQSMKLVHTVDVGPKPQEVLVSPDGRTAYVSCLGTHQVVAVDTATWQVLAKIDVGEKADGMAWVPGAR